MDRFGNVYFGFGGNTGKSLTVVSASEMGGWWKGPYDYYQPTEKELRDYLNGFTIDGTYAFLGAGGSSYSPSQGNAATEGGIGSPQIGVDLTYSWKIGRIGAKW